jgi:hypothetical protein
VTLTSLIGSLVSSTTFPVMTPARTRRNSTSVISCRQLGTTWHPVCALCPWLDESARDSRYAMRRTDTGRPLPFFPVQSGPRCRLYRPKPGDDSRVSACTNPTRVDFSGEPSAALTTRSLTLQLPSGFGFLCLVWTLGLGLPNRLPAANITVREISCRRTMLLLRCR